MGDGPTSYDDDEDEEDEEEEDEEDDEDGDPSFHSRSGKGAIKSRNAGSGRAILGGGISKSTRPAKKGMTWSKGGVSLVGKGRKKRMLCVYDGERRLWKDDMMLHNEFEVRMTLPNGKNYVTDLDVETLKRAEAFHNATQEEKGPWLPSTEADGQGFDLNALMA